MTLLTLLKQCEEQIETSGEEKAFKALVIDGKAEGETFKMFLGVKGEVVIDNSDENTVLCAFPVLELKTAIEKEINRILKINQEFAREEK